MQVESIRFGDEVLTVKCSGAFGIGSEGNASGHLLEHAIENWMLSHVGEHVEQIVIDYSEVDYSWGDGPLWSMLPFIKKGVTTVRFVAGPSNGRPLKELVDTCHLRRFVVEESDD